MERRFTAKWTGKGGGRFDRSSLNHSGSRILVLGQSSGLQYLFTSLNLVTSARPSYHTPRGYSLVSRLGHCEVCDRVKRFLEAGGGGGIGKVYGVRLVRTEKIADADTTEMS